MNRARLLFRNMWRRGECASIQPSSVLVTGMQRGASQIQRQNARNRRGIATIWIILALPALTTLLVVLMDVSNVWLAKTELKNAMDAASLSGAKTWGEGGSTLQARLAVFNASNTNTVLGSVIPLDIAEGGCANGNVSSTSEIVLGSITDTGTVLQFNCNTTPNCGGGIPFAVRTRKTIQINSVASSLFSFVLGPYDVTAESYARYACPAGPPQLVRVESVVCACP